MNPTPTDRHGDAEPEAPEFPDFVVQTERGLAYGAPNAQSAVDLAWAERECDDTGARAVKRLRGGYRAIARFRKPIMQRDRGAVRP